MSQPNSQSTRSHGSVLSYSVGFLLSLLLTVLAYTLVVNGSLSPGILFASIIGLALAQLLVQLIFFLHLDRENKPHWNLMVFVFTVGVVVIIVFGTLWIMYNLDYHHGGNLEIKSPEQIIEDEGIRP